MADEETKAQRGGDFSDYTVNWQQNSGDPHPKLSLRCHPLPLLKVPEEGRRRSGVGHVIRRNKGVGCLFNLHKVGPMPPVVLIKNLGFGRLK